MFEAKMAGGINDPDDLVIAAFKAFDEEGELKKRQTRNASSNRFLYYLLMHLIYKRGELIVPHVLRKQSVYLFSLGIKSRCRACICKRLRSPGIDSASLCSLAGRYNK
jgi:hypothetical protein